MNVSGNLPRDYNFRDPLTPPMLAYRCGTCGRTVERATPPKRPDFCSHRCARKGRR